MNEWSSYYSCWPLLLQWSPSFLAPSSQLLAVEAAAGDEVVVVETVAFAVAGG